MEKPPSTAENGIIAVYAAAISDHIAKGGQITLHGQNIEPADARHVAPALLFQAGIVLVGYDLPVPTITFCRSPDSKIGYIIETVEHAASSAFMAQFANLIFRTDLDCCPDPSYALDDVVSEFKNVADGAVTPQGRAVLTYTPIDSEVTTDAVNTMLNCNRLFIAHDTTRQALAAATTP